MTRFPLDDAKVLWSDFCKSGTLCRIYAFYHGMNPANTRWVQARRPVYVQKPLSRVCLYQFV